MIRTEGLFVYSCSILHCLWVCGESTLSMCGGNSHFTQSHACDVATMVMFPTVVVYKSCSNDVRGSFKKH